MNTFIFAYVCLPVLAYSLFYLTFLFDLHFFCIFLLKMADVDSRKMLIELVKQNHCI